MDVKRQEWKMRMNVHRGYNVIAMSRKKMMHKGTERKRIKSYMFELYVAECIHKECELLIYLLFFADSVGVCSLSWSYSLSFHVVVVHILFASRSLSVPKRIRDVKSKLVECNVSQICRWVVVRSFFCVLFAISYEPNIQKQQLPWNARRSCTLSRLHNWPMPQGAEKTHKNTHRSALNVHTANKVYAYFLAFLVSTSLQCSDAFVPNVWAYFSGKQRKTMGRKRNVNFYSRINVW